MDEIPELFTYTPFSNHDPVCVVKLLPGEFNGAIECETSSVEPKTQPPYEAFSYVWGDAKDTTPIAMNR